MDVRTGARSGMKRSPRTRTSLEVIVAARFSHGVEVRLRHAGVLRIKETDGRAASRMGSSRLPVHD